ncbi:hypothetical protein ZHAS_00007331 [Anopheles sinensis]|uniref:Uncharacterized protein n=1 Tax=Anopheles sinensis TaxID=74873 RepID=A0A084VPQ4_ANOSI|nr:hypothetical protein ZHAS_00007331 [Anopheles sinensis]
MPPDFCYPPAPTGRLKGRSKTSRSHHRHGKVGRNELWRCPPLCANDSRICWLSGKLKRTKTKPCMRAIDARERTSTGTRCTTMQETRRGGCVVLFDYLQHTQARRKVDYSAAANKNTNHKESNVEGVRRNRGNLPRLVQRVGVGDDALLWPSRVQSSASRVVSNGSRSPRHNHKHVQTLSTNFLSLVLASKRFIETVASEPCTQQPSRGKLNRDLPTLELY